MKLYDVYNDGGFVMRSTLPMIARVFDLHRAAVDRILYNEARGEETDLHLGNNRRFNGMVLRVFAATVPLEPSSNVFGE